MPHPEVMLCEVAPTPWAWTLAEAGPIVPRETVPMPAAGPWVEVVGPEPGRHPDLLKHLRALSEGRRIKLHTAGDLPASARALVEAGVAVFVVHLHDPDPARDAAWRGQPSRALAFVEEAVAAGGAKVELCVTLAADAGEVMPAVLALARRLRLTVHLRPTGPLPDRLVSSSLVDVGLALDALLAAAGVLDLRVDAFSGPPAGEVAAAPVRWSPSQTRALLADVRTPGSRAGCVAGGALPSLPGVRAEDHGHALAAWGCPPLDRPADEGGAGAARSLLPGWTPAPGPRVLVLNGAVADKVLTLSTLPALVRALRALGAEVVSRSVWEEGVVTSGPARRSALAAAGDADAALLQGAPLDAADLVVVPGYPHAARVLRDPRLNRFARVVVADLHLCHEVRSLTSLFDGPDDPRWERVVIHSCFPGYVRLYLRAGVPIRQVVWRPYPIDPETFAPGPEPSTCAGVFAGGNQRRAWATLTEAVRRLPMGPEVTLITRDPVASVPGLRVGSPIDLRPFYDTLAHHRAVVVPVAFEADIASGLTVVSLALAAGRPVVASRTPAMIDHLRDGHDSLFVPPGDPAALAAALQRLQDDALVQRLAVGARQGADRASVATWARELLCGAPPRRVVGSGPYSPW